MLVGDVEVRAHVHEVPISKVDEGGAVVAGNIVRGHQYLYFDAQLSKISASATGIQRAVADDSAFGEAVLGGLNHLPPSAAL